MHKYDDKSAHVVTSMSHVMLPKLFRCINVLVSSVFVTKFSKCAKPCLGASTSCMSIAIKPATSLSIWSQTIKVVAWSAPPVHLQNGLQSFCGLANQIAVCSAAYCLNASLNKKNSLSFQLNYPCKLERAHVYKRTLTW